MGGFSGADELEQGAAYRKAVEQQMSKEKDIDIQTDIRDVAVVSELKYHPSKNQSEKAAVSAFYHEFMEEKYRELMARRQEEGLSHIDFEK